MQEQPQKIVLSDDTVDQATIPTLHEGMTEKEMLDYMVLIISEQLSCSQAFKGGYMLNQLLKGHSRTTHDIDFSIALKGDYDGVKRILQKIAEDFISKNLISSYKIKEDIAERCSGGIDMFDDSGRKVLGVDVGLHNISYGIKHYDLSFTGVEAFSIERMLADKLIAITTRKRFRRAKDLFDVYAITSFFDVDMQKLTEYVELRGGAEWEHIPFDDTVLEQYEHAWNKLDLRSYEDGIQIDKPEFLAAVNRYYALAIPVKNKEALTRWDHQHGYFI